MNFANRITRTPRAYDPDRAGEVMDLFAGLSGDMKQVLAGAGGSSPYLYGVMQKEADWLRRVLEGTPEDGLAAVLKGVADLAPNALVTGLRQAKGKVALLTGLADLAGVWDLGQVTTALTDFADLAVDRGVQTLVAAEIDRGKLPGMGENDKKTAAGMTVLAMGKMGAHELNYSSDIDLICLFDETRFEPDDYAEARKTFIRVTRRLSALLSELTGDGYVFRTDLRLRPDPSVTPVCLSMETALQYYESVGRTWERAAHIKARPCAGDIDAGWRYLNNLRPFIWRKHLDFAAIQDAHDMRLRIREHKRLHGPIVLEGHNMKLGAGGIREIEFFTQTRQIIAGGRDQSLRSRATLEGLVALQAKDWVDADVAQALGEDYQAHREIEHRLQMINDAQTHDLPKTEDGFARLAALCGRDLAELRDDMTARLSRVADLTEGFFAPQSTGSTSPDIGPDMAPKMSPAIKEAVARWRSYPSLRSPRAAEIFQRIMPIILTGLQRAARPDEALIQFDNFLAGLPAGVQVFSLFEANPQLIDLIVDIAASAPVLATYLGRNSQVFDAVIGGDFFAPWPDGDVLQLAFTRNIGPVAGYEGKLDAVRQVMKEWHFRIGVHHLRGLINADEAGAQYSALAEAVLNAVWPVVVDEFASKHGDPPGRGAAVIGMGSLGAQRLSAASDLDLIVVYDPNGVDVSVGRRPLASRVYYARLTQALVTALSAPMAEGRLYEVDMRLRPSGRQGPVATALQAFVSYQMEQAWTWEHLALTRARPVAGNLELGAEIEALRKRIIATERAPKKVLADVAEMREKLTLQKPRQGIWDAKLGPGRAQDIALFAQSAALLAGDASRKTCEQLAAGVRIGWISQADRAQLLAADALMWHLQSAARLLSGDVLDLDVIGQGGVAFVLRVTEACDADELASSIDLVTKMAARVIDLGIGDAPKIE
ncbi:MAG: bifunctional [glutamine synthetase] adenylyltransferase/[glutamine synthetase]-adenylyl-L-tyrosine phosphorylase [Paracoccaceae bacterium]